MSSLWNRKMWKSDDISSSAITQAVWWTVMHMKPTTHNSSKFRHWLVSYTATEDGQIFLAMCTMRFINETFEVEQ